MSENNKIIHYCWFGGGPLSDLTKKCIESWKKFLPDFEIKEWNEKNFDINQCEFIKQAYEQKKWAFVADYTRFKVLEEFGGLYLDTDMEITKDISKYLDHDLFFGVEDSNMINAAVVWAKDKNNEHIKNIVDYYEEIKEFNPTGDLYKESVPQVLTSYFSKHGFNQESLELQLLDEGHVHIYPMEYFYPLSYDYQHNKFTENTCMIHHFDATWISKMEKFKTTLKRRNMKWIVHIIDFFINSKNRVKSFINYKDISIFLSTFLILFLTTMSFKRIDNFNYSISNYLVVFHMIFSLVWTIICKQIRTIDINNLLDINLLENLDNNNRKRHINDERKNEILRYENKIFTLQLLLTAFLLILPNMYFVNILGVSNLFFGISLLILTTMIYVGIKKEFKYRILDLIVISFALAFLVSFSISGLIIAVVLFSCFMFLLFKVRVNKKKILAFIGSLIIIVGSLFIIRFSMVQNSKYYDINISFDNFYKVDTINMSNTNEINAGNNITKFDFGKDILNSIMKYYESIPLKFLLSPTVILYISLIIIVLLALLLKKVEYLLLCLPQMLNFLLNHNRFLNMNINFIFLLFSFILLFMCLFRKIYKNNKIKMY